MTATILIARDVPQAILDKIERIIEEGADPETEAIAFQARLGQSNLILALMTRIERLEEKMREYLPEIN